MSLNDSQGIPTVIRTRGQDIRRTMNICPKCSANSSIMKSTIKSFIIELGVTQWQSGDHQNHLDSSSGDHQFGGRKFHDNPSNSWDISIWTDWLTDIAIKRHATGAAKKNYRWKTNFSKYLKSFKIWNWQFMFCNYARGCLPFIIFSWCKTVWKYLTHLMTK